MVVGPRPIFSSSSSSSSSIQLFSSSMIHHPSVYSIQAAKCTKHLKAHRNVVKQCSICRKPEFRRAECWDEVLRKGNKWRVPSHQLGVCQSGGVFKAFYCSGNKTDVWYITSALELTKQNINEAEHNGHLWKKVCLHKKYTEKVVRLHTNPRLKWSATSEWVGHRKLVGFKPPNPPANRTLTDKLTT